MIDFVRLRDVIVIRHSDINTLTEYQGIAFQTLYKKKKKRMTRLMVLPVGLRSRPLWCTGIHPNSTNKLLRAAPRMTVTKIDIRKNSNHQKAGRR